MWVGEEGLAQGVVVAVLGSAGVPVRRTCLQEL